MREIQVQSLGREDPLMQEWQLTPVFLPGRLRGQRSLVAYSPWGHKESDTTEQLWDHEDKTTSEGLNCFYLIFAYFLTHL